MKKLIFFKIGILTVFFNLLFLISWGQQVEIDKRLEKNYDSEYLKFLQSNSPKILEVLNFELDNSWFIAKDNIKEKIKTLNFLCYKDTDIPVKEIDLNNINISDYSIKRGVNSRVYYRVGDTGTVIGFYSHNEVAQMFNKEKGLSYEKE